MASRKVLPDLDAHGGIQLSVEEELDPLENLFAVSR